MDNAAQKQRLHDRGICVVIPTYNNAGTIVDVVARTLGQCRDVIVVCDGCTDDTVPRLQKMPELPVIIELKENRGKGVALKAGFRYALESGFAYAITLDGDGQHYPEDIPLLLKANIDHPGTLIVGERKYTEEMERSGGSKFANRFSNFWFAVQTGCCLKDTQTGYRLYPLKKLCCLSLLSSRYEAELGLMVLASWHGIELVGVGVNVYYPPKNERVSHFRPGKDFVRIFAMNMLLCVLALVYGWPLRLFRLTAKVFRTFYTLFFFVLASAFVLSPLLFLYAHVWKMSENGRCKLHRIITAMARFVLFGHKLPGVRYSQSNPFREDFRKPAVIICNHQSHLDLLPMLALSPKLVVVTADWVWHNPIYRYVIRCAEFVPASSGMEEMMPQLRSLADRGYSIAVYPEGTRSVDGRVGRFHQGAFHIAGRLGLDVIPLVLCGSGIVLSKKAWLLRKGRMHLAIDARISSKELLSFGETPVKQAAGMRAYYRNRYAAIADKMDQEA